MMTEGEAKLSRSLDCAVFLSENAPGLPERQYAETIRWLLEKRIKSIKKENSNELARPTRTD